MLPNAVRREYDKLNKEKLKSCIQYSNELTKLIIEVVVAKDDKRRVMLDTDGPLHKMLSTH